MTRNELLPPNVARDFKEAQDILLRVKAYLQESIKGKDMVLNTGGKYHGRTGPVNSSIINTDSHGELQILLHLYPYKKDGSGVVSWNQDTKSYRRIEDVEWPLIQGGKG